MGTSSHDIFGEPPGVQPATPGTYGLAPDGFRLPEGTRLGPVRLQVGDIERSLAFYEEVLGMRRLERDGAHAVLGAQSSPLVELHERKGAAPATRRARTGLFHFAILLPDRPALGRFVAHAGRLGLHLGAGDHLVSESLYLDDPDGLGIEIYADRPRGSWQRIGRQLMMATDPLDTEGLLADGGAAPWTGMPAGTSMGHVHLHVGDLDRAAAFYTDALGFDRTVWDYPGALFMAAGGYHHHIGTNVWAGPAAQPPPANEAQLLDWSIELPDVAHLESAAESLERGGYEVSGLTTDGHAEVLTRDPWGTGVRLRAGEDTQR